MKTRNWPKVKIFLVFCLIAVVIIAYGVWQYYGQLLQSTTNGEGDLATPFSLTDIHGAQFFLGLQSGRVIVVHFMSVGCGGQVWEIDDNQLKQMRAVCNMYCDSEAVTLVTVAVSTCETSDLEEIRDEYGIAWTFGNDYEDGKLDIVAAYEQYSIDDGTIILIDKSFHVAQVYRDAITADTMSSRISQLLGD